MVNVSASSSLVISIRFFEEEGCASCDEERGCRNVTSGVVKAGMLQEATACDKRLRAGPPRVKSGRNRNMRK
jgi:hypothetical protein